MTVAYCLKITGYGRNPREYTLREGDEGFPAVPPADLAAVLRAAHAIAAAAPTEVYSVTVGFMAASVQRVKSVSLARGVHTEWKTVSVFTGECGWRNSGFRSFTGMGPVACASPVYSSPDFLGDPGNPVIADVVRELNRRP